MNNWTRFKQMNMSAKILSIAIIIFATGSLFAPFITLIVEAFVGNSTNGYIESLEKIFIYFLPSFVIAIIAVALQGLQVFLTRKSQADFKINNLVVKNWWESILPLRRYVLLVRWIVFSIMILWWWFAMYFFSVARLGIFPMWMIILIFTIIFPFLIGVSFKKKIEAGKINIANTFKTIEQVEVANKIFSLNLKNKAELIAMLKKLEDLVDNQETTQDQSTHTPKDN